MPVKDESDYLHLRLRGEVAAAIRKAARERRRSLTEEATIAIENHLYQKRAKKKKS